MRFSINLAICSGIVCAVVSAGPIYAAEKALVGTAAPAPGMSGTLQPSVPTQGIKRPGATIAAPLPTVAVQLTAEECTKLGGTVQEGAAFCNSRRLCKTVDQNGVGHAVCLTARRAAERSMRRDPPQ